jgi:hypothetical protein
MRALIIIRKKAQIQENLPFKIIVSKKNVSEVSIIAISW